MDEKTKPSGVQLKDIAEQKRQEEMVKEHSRLAQKEKELLQKSRSLLTLTDLVKPAPCSSDSLCLPPP